MRNFYIRLLLFSQFDSQTITELTGWQIPTDLKVREIAPPDFGNALHSLVSISPGTMNFAALTVYSALTKLSDKTLAKKFSVLSNNFSKSELILDSTVDFPVDIQYDDFKHWTDKPYWSLEETVLMSLGLYPDRQTIEDFKKVSYRSGMSSNLLHEYRLRHKLAKRELKRGGIAANQEFVDRCIPGKSLIWLKESGFQVSDSLIDHISISRLDSPKKLLKKPPLANNKISELKIDNNKESAEDLNPKERTTFLKLVHAMARARPFNFDSENTKNGAIGRVENAVLDADLELSQKTIRKYLVEAAQEAARLKEKDQ